MPARSSLRLFGYVGAIGCLVAVVCLQAAGHGGDTVTALLLAFVGLSLVIGIIADRRVREVRMAVKRRDAAFYDARRLGASGADAWRNSEHLLNPAFPTAEAGEDDGERRVPSA